MQCVILAAGKGTRMGKLTDDCPKPMLPIKGKPKLAYTLENLPEEIDKIILVIGYLGKQIRNFFGDEYNDLKIKYVEQRELNGSAGAVALTEKFIVDKFLVLMGDDLYLKDDLKKMLNYNWALLAYKTSQADQFGLVSIDESNYLTSVIERPHNQRVGLVNTGAYILSLEYFKIPLVPISKTEFGLPQTLVSMYPKIKTKVTQTKFWQPVGSPDDLAKAEEWLELNVS